MSMSGRSLYAALSIQNQLIKIGSSSNPEVRINSFSTSNPSGIRRLAIVDDFGKYETAIHWLLHDKRERGEWFSISVDQCAAIFAALGNQNFITVLKRILSLPHSRRPKFLIDAQKIATAIFDGSFDSIDIKKLPLFTRNWEIRLNRKRYSLPAKRAVVNDPPVPKNPVAQAMANLRWQRMTPEQRKAAMEPARKKLAAKRLYKKNFIESCQEKLAQDDVA